ASRRKFTTELGAVMSIDHVMDRLRRANPAPARMIENEPLLVKIIASPADPRLARSNGQPVRRRRVWRWLGVGARVAPVVGATIVAIAIAIIALAALHHAHNISG